MHPVVVAADADTAVAPPPLGNSLRHLHLILSSIVGNPRLPLASCTSAPIRLYQQRSVRMTSMLGIIVPGIDDVVLVVPELHALIHAEYIHIHLSSIYYAA